MAKVKDAYQEYVEKKKRKEEKNPPEETAERRVSLNLGLRDIVVLLDLIKENTWRYGEADQVKIKRVESRLRAALRG